MVQFRVTGLGLWRGKKRKKKGWCCKSSIRYALLTDANSHIHHLSETNQIFSRPQTELKEGFQSSSQTKFTAEALNLYELHVFFRDHGAKPDYILPPKVFPCSAARKKRKEGENVCVLLFMIKIWIEFVTALQHLRASWALT